MKKHVLVAPLKAAGLGNKPLTYAAETAIPTGSIVQVPLGRRRSLGVVVGVTPKPDFTTKPIEKVLATGVVEQTLIDLASWMSDYYGADLGRVWQTILPAGIAKRRRQAPPAASKLVLAPLQESLSAGQQAVIKAIGQSSQLKHLLFGVTGSGKTQIYIELARHQVAAGKSVIILVPEISLTPQVVAQFEAVFGQQVLVNHSHLTEAQRHRVWEQVQVSSRPVVAIGPRSALFLPVSKLGLIVIDECHESSYKQEQSPRYHAIATGAKLADLTGARLVLGSATPGLNEVYLAQAGRLQLHRLNERISSYPMPPVEIIDLRQRDLLTRSTLLSEPLLRAVKSTLDQSRQSLLFLNRRGSASAHICADCGWVEICPNCELPLTFHADQLRSICHFCNHRQTPAGRCPSCGSSALKFTGSGTQKLEAEIARLFPGARLARLDRDTARKTDLTVMYGQLLEGKIDILIGTQMIAKGLDLPLLDTVGIINADSALYLPDYTASERCFQLVNQVSGRAGRRGQSATVFIQTYTPDHPAIQAAHTHDFWGFAEAELKSRQLLGYPPYRYLLKLSSSAKTAATAQKQAEQMAAELSPNRELAIIGPAPAFRELQGGKYHWQLIVKAGRRSALQKIAASVKGSWTVDLDPQNLL